MNALSPATGAPFLARYDALADRLPGDRAVRREAAEAFRATGLPTVRDEAWKYTSLRALAELSFREPLPGIAAGSPDLAEAALLDAAALPDLPRLVFVGGRYRPDLSSPDPRSGFVRFADAPDFAALPETPLVTLNTMLAEDGARLHVAAGVDAGCLLLVSLAPYGGPATAFHPRHRIVLEAGARLSLIEIATGAGAYLHNPLTSIEIGQGGHLAHLRVQEEAPEAFHLASLHVELAARAAYEGCTLHLGGRLSRTELHARLAGPGARLEANGVQLLRGRQHGDLTTLVRHAAPSCASRQTIKSVLDDTARGVFQGRIDVDRIAQKTDGYQMNQALLLSPGAEIDTKPQLQIHADDVKCSHGATVGALDDSQLFYLVSRGIPRDEARAILVRAFLAEAVDMIADGDARAVAGAAIDRAWGHAT